MPHRFFRFLLVTALASAVAAQDHDIGKIGAKVRLTKDWKRHKVNPDLGEDQFVCSVKTGLFTRASAYVIARELDMLLEGEDDFVKAFGLLSTVGQETRIELTKTEDCLRGTRTFDAEVNGTKASFRLELLSKAGTSWFLLCWSGASDKKHLGPSADQFLRSLQFPAADSAWGLTTQPQTFTVQCGGFDLVFQHRPSVLRRQPLEDQQILHLSSADDEHAAFAFAVDHPSAQATLDAAAGAVGSNSEGFRELSRADLDVAGAAGRRMIAQFTGGTVHVVALPLEPGKFLDVRYVSTGAPAQVRADRDLFFKTLQLRPAATVLTLPEPGAARPAAMPTRLAAVLATARKLGEVAQAASSVERQADGRFLVCGYAKSVLVAADGTTANVQQARGAQRVVLWGEQCLSVRYDDTVAAFVDGVEQPSLAFQADALCTHGDRLLLARPQPSAVPKGVWAGNMGADLLVLRARDGVETRVLELPDLSVGCIASDGRRALLWATHRPSPWGAAGRSLGKLLQVDTASGETSDFGAWMDVTCIAAAEGGWLVTGRPHQRPHGIHLLRGPDSCVPLLTGARILGVALQQRRLVVARLDYGSCGLYEVDTEAASVAGSLCQPFAVRTLNAIGQRVLGDATCRPPRTAAEVRSALAAAHRVAQELTGSDLPRADVDVDALFEEVSATRGVEPAGRIVLALVVAGSYLDRGATWVDCAAAEWSDWLVRTESVGDSAFTVSWQPSAVVSMVLDDSEGISDPGTHLADMAAGRTLLFGIDPLRLREQTAAAEPPGLRRAVDDGDEPAIAQILEARSGNHHAREQIYGHLTSRGRIEVAEALARRFATGPSAHASDHRFWLGAWSQRLQSPADAEALIAAASKAVQQHPGESALYWYLGLAYEKAKPAELAFARTCYRRAVQMQSWGDVGTAAAAALERLGN